MCERKEKKAEMMNQVGEDSEKKVETPEDREKKERNKVILTVLLVAAVGFELLREEIGTFLTAFIYLVIIGFIFKRKYPEKFERYKNILLNKKELPKDLNK